jgi:hypothetical protein
MGEIYKDFPIRDQDTESRQTLDLLQCWGGPGGGFVGLLVERGFTAVRSWWQGQ